MPDLHLTAEEINAWDGLLKARQHLTEKVEEKLKQSGLPPYSWYDVLFELEKSPDGSLRLNDLGEKVQLNKYNVTRLIDRLEKDGLVSRDACPVDGRGKLACITEKGRMTRQEMWPVYHSVIKEFFLSQFNSSQLKELVESVEKINSQFDH